MFRKGRDPLFGLPLPSEPEHENDIPHKLLHPEIFFFEMGFRCIKVAAFIGLGG